MATNSAQRVRAARTRRRRREVQLTLEVSETDLREIALAGMPTPLRRTANAGKTPSHSSSATSVWPKENRSVAAQRKAPVSMVATQRGGCGATGPCYVVTGA